MLLLIIGLLAIASIISIVGAVCCCIAGGRADDEMEKMAKREVK